MVKTGPTYPTVITIFLQPTGTGGTITGLYVSPADYVGRTSFAVLVKTSAPTTVAVDVWYVIFN
jgi:hypothetical protein